VPTHYDAHTGRRSTGWDDAAFASSGPAHRVNRRVARAKRWVETNARLIAVGTVFVTLMVYTVACMLSGQQASEDRTSRAKSLHETNRPPRRAATLAPPSLARIERMMLGACENSHDGCCITAREVGEDVNAVGMVHSVNGPGLTIVMFDPQFSPARLSSKSAVSTHASDEVFWVHNTVIVDYIDFGGQSRSVTLHGDNAYCLQHMLERQFKRA